MNLGWRLAITVGKFFQDLIYLLITRKRTTGNRKLLVGLKAQSFTVDVVVRDARIDGKLEAKLRLAFGDVAAEG